MSISVIVATYGDEEWMRLGLRRAGQSIEPQDPDDFVGLHVNDGTVASSRNEAAALATEDWLLFCDADDELAPGYVGAMERALEQAGANGKRSLFTPAVSTIRNGRASPPTFFKEVPLRQANWLVVGTLVHRDLFWEVGGFPEAEHGLEDWALWSKCVRDGATIVRVPDAVYRYWANPNSMHRVLWRDKKKQVAAHRRVADELDAWEAARAPAA